jgi:hypothetical protein
MLITYDVCEVRWEYHQGKLIPRWTSTPLTNATNKLAYGMAKRFRTEPKYRGANILVVRNGTSPISKLTKKKEC